MDPQKWWFPIGISFSAGLFLVFRFHAFILWGCSHHWPGTIAGGRFSGTPTPIWHTISLSNAHAPISVLEVDFIHIVDCLGNRTNHPGWIKPIVIIVNSEQWDKLSSWTGLPSSIKNSSSHMQVEWSVGFRNQCFASNICWIFNSGSYWHYAFQLFTIEI